MIYNIKDFGAIADKAVDSTVAIQKAIDACFDAGGGTVLFPSGETFCSGTIVLKDNVNLCVESGALWYGSTDVDLYPLNTSQPKESAANLSTFALIFADHAKNISITGLGTISGEGDKSPFHVTSEDQNKDVKRPKVIHFIACESVIIKDVTLRNSASWMMSLFACEIIKISGITISNRRSSVNNDGIDLNSCKDVTVSNCIINSEDDAIVLKSTADKFTENVVITNCVLTTHCNAFKCGTESIGGFRNITFSNSVIYETYLSGIALEMMDGGEMNGMNISNISMRKVNNPIFIKLGNIARQLNADAAKTNIGTMKNIMISNIQADDIGGFVEEPVMEFSHKHADEQTAACQLSGLPEHNIENVTLRDIRLSFNGCAMEKDVRNTTVPEREDSYPEFSTYGVLPAFGLFARHLNNVTFENVEITVNNKQDSRYAYFLEDVKYARLNNIYGDTTADDSIMKLADCCCVDVKLSNMVKHSNDAIITK